LQPAAKKQRLDVNGTAATPASAGGASSTIFVGNLPWSATEDDIANLFADCGEVKGVRIGELSCL
jgi:RNA recognition motif-containing protein